MKILKVDGIGDKQRVRETNLVGALKASNQANPRSSGTTLVVGKKKSKLIGVLMFGRSDEGKQSRRESMKKGKDYTPFRSKDPHIRTDGIMNCLTGAISKDNLIVVTKRRRK